MQQTALGGLQTKLQQKQHASTSALPTLSPSTVAKFINLNQCGRFLHLKHATATSDRQPLIHKDSIDPELAASGLALEEHVQAALDAAGVHIITSAAIQSSEVSWVEFAAGLAELSTGQWGYGREVALFAHVDGLGVAQNGRADFLMLRWTKQGRPVLRVVECKASKEPQTMHLIQVSDRLVVGRVLIACQSRFDGF